MHAIAASVSGPHRSMEAMDGGGAHMSMSAMVALSSDASRAASDRSMASDSSSMESIEKLLGNRPQANAPDSTVLAIWRLLSLAHPSSAQPCPLPRCGCRR